MASDCFIICPITTPPDLVDRYQGDSDHFVHVIQHLFEPAAKAAGFTPYSPIARGADLIHAEIIRHLESADMVLCDMTSLNANVFFELGIRTAIDKPICLVRDSYTHAIPFDAGILNAHQYDPGLLHWNIEADIRALAEHLTQSALGSDGRNTLWRYFGLTTSGNLPNPADSTTEEKIDILLQEVVNLGRTDPMVLGPHPYVELDRILREKTGAILSEARIADALDLLDTRQYQVLRLRFGFDGTGPRSMGLVAEELGMSLPAARDALSRAITRLVHYLRPASNADT
jgi:hypothetical protein